MTSSSAPQLSLRYDLRAPTFGAPRTALYAAAIEQCAWAESQGFGLVSVAEHHGSDDGYLPSPFVFAAALAARTRALTLRIAACILPLYHPLRAAEDAAVLDIASNGRLELVIGAGYRPEEFAMYGVDLDSRVSLVEEGVATLRRAWTGDPFIFRGERVVVSPTPVQKGGPQIILGGMSHGAARRAARIADGFMPGHGDLADTYKRECLKRGSQPNLYSMGNGPPFLHVTDDPERDSELIAPHALHEATSYACWMHNPQLGPFQPVTDFSMLKGAYVVVTPQQAIDLLRPLWRDGNCIGIHPLMGGLSPELAWASLELLASQVLPELRRSSEQAT